MNKLETFNSSIAKMVSISEDLSQSLDALIVLDRDDYRDTPLQDIARMMKTIQNLHESLDASKGRIGVLFDNIRTVHLPERMDEDDITNFRVEGLGTVSLTSDLRVKVLDKDREFEWLEEIGSGDLITNTVNASSLKALLRRKIAAGEEIPADVFEVSAFTRASVTKR